MWSSPNTPPAVIPDSALYYATPIVGSPYAFTVAPGSAAYPHTHAYGDGVSAAVVAREWAEVIIQAKVCTL